MDEPSLVYFLSETIGLAVIDSGASKTVCGEKWLKWYLATLSNSDRRSVYNCDSGHKFVFGDGKQFASPKIVAIPVYLTKHTKITLLTDVVSADIPLLISRDTLQKTNANIDFKLNKITMLGEEIDVVVSESGHYCLPLARLPDANDKHTAKVLFSYKFDDEQESNYKKIVKLHRQFCHPKPESLYNLIKTSGTDDPSIRKICQEVYSNCESCQRYGTKKLRPVVAFPSASVLNERLAVDLKQFGKLYILHIIDHVTRYSAACLITNKRKGTIVKGILEFWIRIFGAPQSILSDNGGEFVNDELTDLSEKFNICLKSTAAESAWSNGLVERHNGVLAGIIKKVMAKEGCGLDVALQWAISAKNSLTNVYGFSPNTLVFGRNPSFPNYLENRAPANNPLAISKYIADNLSALHAAREAAVQQEACEKLKRASLRKVRSYSDVKFVNGDIVYFYKNDSDFWHGPAKVIGSDGQQHLLKQGGNYYRVHPCKMSHVQNVDFPGSAVQQEVTRVDIPEERECVSSMPENFLEMADEVTSSPDNENSIRGSSQVDTGTNSDDETHGATSSATDNSLVRSGDTGQSRGSDNCITVVSKNDLPPVSSHISFKLPGQDDWKDGFVISRAGKMSGNNWHYLNIQENFQEVCHSFRDAQWKEVPMPAEESFISSTTETDKEQEIYVAASPDEDLKWEQAKKEEIQKWIELRAHKDVPYTGQNCLSTRWVLTTKVKDNKTIFKARLVVRGFEEDTSSLQTDSPTCCKESLRIALGILASRRWKLHSLDVKSAFLQGQPIERELYVKPPKQANATGVWRLLKCPYGLADAGRNWFLRVKQELVRLEAYQSEFDGAFFAWYNENELCGVIAIHVDDMLFGGTTLFHSNVISVINSTFKIGSQSDTCFTYIGLQVSQFTNKINLSMKQYIASLTEIDITSPDKQKKLSPDGVRNLKKVSGQINWAVTQCRPDLAYENCYIGNCSKSACEADLHFANKVIRRLKCQDVSLSFHAEMNLTDCFLVSFCDASFGNLPNGGSQGAFFTLLVDKAGNYAPIAWQSRRIRRVVKSTIAAECLAAIEAAESSYLMASILKDILGDRCKIQTMICWDNRGLCDSVFASTTVEDKRLFIDICVLRDMIHNHEINEFRWVSTDQQIANALTKQGASTHSLVQLLNNKLHFNFTNSMFE